MEVRPLCLACSCLLEDDIVLAKNFANKFNIKFVMKYEESVTHLIVRVNKENCAERSLKFINAVVSGIWVLNKKWIIESLAAQKLLPEYKYEVLDISLEPGPKRNRLTSPSSLFNNIKVFIIGPFHSTSNDEFKALLRKSGVLVQNNFIAAQMIVVDDGEQTKDEIEEIYKKYLKPVVDMGWFLDCICRGRLVKMVDHLLMPELSELNVKNYPSQLFQDTERI
uniref:Putative product n=1 Tax=Xenopsylla cheopis TaxID=163159 RepID=A0A6M2E0L2_XENCH